MVKFLRNNYSFVILIFFSKRRAHATTMNPCQTRLPMKYLFVNGGHDGGGIGNPVSVVIIVVCPLQWMPIARVLNKFDMGDESAGLYTYIRIHIHVCIYIYIYIYIIQDNLLFTRGEARNRDTHRRGSRQRSTIPSTPSRAIIRIRSTFLSNRTLHRGLAPFLLRSEHATAQRHHSRVPFPSLFHTPI